jgi:cell shape-determining protein MreC
MKPAVDVTRDMQRKVAKVHPVASLHLLVHLYACNNNNNNNNNKRISEQIFIEMY